MSKPYSAYSPPLLKRKEEAVEEEKNSLVYLFVIFFCSGVIVYNSIDLLTAEAASLSTLLVPVPEVNAIIHCFSGNA